MPQSHPGYQLRQRNWVGALRGFARWPAPTGERCDLCGTPIALAACPPARPCQPAPALRVRGLHQALGGRRARRLPAIPDEVRALPDFRISDQEWDALMIPIGLAFFYRAQHSARVTAMYPGPAGAVHSLLDLDAWHSLVEHNPELGALRAEVEALLIYRINNARRYYIVPIDRCYALAGLLRQQWHGAVGRRRGLGIDRRLLRSAAIAGRPAGRGSPTWLICHSGSKALRSNASPPLRSCNFRCRDRVPRCRPQHAQRDVAMPDPDRDHATRVRARMRNPGSAICSAIRSNGAARCRGCCGRMPAPWYPRSSAPAWHRCRCRAVSISTSPPPSISMALPAARCRCLLLFSGAVFYDDGQGLQISQIGWDQEVRYRLPVALWQDMMHLYYPDSAWLRLPRSVFARLERYKRQHALTAWEQALERLLDAQERLDRLG
jgi:hypothetical protein